MTRSHPDAPGWGKVRKAIIERDSYRCRICRNDAEKLEVHHIDYDRSRNNDGNLVTLCGPCHRAVHRERYKPSDHEDWLAPWGIHPSEYEYSDPA